MSDTPESELLRLVRAINARGYTVEFKNWIEDSETPGMLGQGCGVVVYHRQAVKIRTEGRALEQIIAALAHEFDHIEGREPEDNPAAGLRCGGSRNVFGEPKE